MQALAARCEELRARTGNPPLHCFQLRTTLDGMDFKFVSHGLWSEKQNILRQHMHKKGELDFDQ
jgi:hypothetical protein